MPDVDLERAERLVVAATPGPWTTDEDGCCVYAGMPDDPRPIAHVAVDAEGTEADAVFIAAARDLVPTLLARVRALTAAGDTLAAALRSCRSQAYDFSTPIPPPR